MARFYFRYPIYSLLLAVSIISSCNGQVNTSSPDDKANTSKPSPEIIGTPPLFSHVDPVNDPGIVSQYIRSIFQDSKGNFWFGTVGQSVVRYDGTTLKYYSEVEFFQGKSIHAIDEDKNGNIWFGTDHGVIKYDARLPDGQGSTFKSYTENNGLSNIKVGRKCILIDKSGTIWVGTQGGAFRYSPSADSTGGKCFSLFDLLPSVNIKDIMEDKDGNIWFASQDDGVFCYNPSATLRSNGKAIKNITGKEGLGDNYAGGMIQDKTGNFWFTMKGGICRYDPAAGFTEFTTKDGLGGSEVWGIYLEKSGIIWITARGSTTRYDPSISNSKAFTVYTVEDGLNCCVQSMYQDKTGNMWWGAGQGLYRFDGKRFYQVKQKGPW